MLHFISFIILNEYNKDKTEHEPISFLDDFTTFFIVSFFYVSINVSYNFKRFVAILS